MNLNHLLFLMVLATLARTWAQEAGGAAGKAETIARAVVPPVIPNRTLPKVEPPISGLEFSASPSPQDFFRARIFEEPLVPVGGEPSIEENRALAGALREYARRTGPDEFSSLTEFLDRHPKSPWRAGLLLNLGLEYYNTAHYSLTLDAWNEAWLLAKDASDAKGKAVGDRAAGELAYMFARLGRMDELGRFFKSIEGRTFVGPATEKISGAREGLWHMQNRPDVSFRCGPLALRRIQGASNVPGTGDDAIARAASTRQGFSLPQVAELSKQVGLNYQMAFREPAGAFVVPSVVHWKVGHYAALVRQEGERYLLEDPTFGNTVWATKEALEAETSGYFLVPSGELSPGWRAVKTKEGAAVWGKGQTTGSDPGPHGPGDANTGGGPCKGMAVSSVHLMLVNLNLSDEPVGYSPPVGPAIRFTVRYNHRDAFQPANFTYLNFGPKWTCDWISYITDNPQSLSADVNHYIRGGGTRTFTGFNTNTQSFASQQYDQTLLKRIGPARYELISGDGSKLVFTHSDGAIGTSRKVFLTQVVDPFGNAATLTYDANLRLVAITDAIGQVTTLTYLEDEPASDWFYTVTRVTDPFGRFATFNYEVAQCQNGQLFFSVRRLASITDTIGLVSRFGYFPCDTGGSGDLVHQLITPYGTNTFLATSGPGTTRSLETVYPDGSRDRVEYNQTIKIPTSEPPASVPKGMSTFNNNLAFRNTYYWSRTACATSYGDYTKAKIYHWLHMEDIFSTAGILQSTKEALEGRVWYDYPGQSAAFQVGSMNQPSHIGRVLDDGSTQLSRFAYNGFGHVTNAIDPVGREMTYIYSTNGIDLLEVRQTRGANDELLSRTTYNQHLALLQTDAAGQTTTNTYNARGQLLTTANPKGETIAYTYDTNGYLIMVDGPLPGTNDVVTATYDSFGRVRTKADESGYTLAFDYDALDRFTKITYPDGTFSEHIYNRLDPAVIRDRAGRQTLLEHDPMRQMTKRTGPLNRVTLFQWCSCGDLSSLTDPMGRTTTWHKDVQGRLTSKEYGDGSQVRYFYENATSRLRQVVDEKQQVKQYTHNRDDTLQSITYINVTVPTPGVSFTYDPNYPRPARRTDGTGTTDFTYHPITVPPAQGANQLASVDGPLPNDTITYTYDELGRRVLTAIDGIAAAMTFDTAGRLTTASNVLGTFTHAYAGGSYRFQSGTLPNGQTVERNYAGPLEDHTLQRITHRIGATPVSEFAYGRDLATHRITRWSQQAGSQPPPLHTFDYDATDQLLAVTITNANALVKTFAYSYDLAGNRLTEQIDGTTTVTTFNPLNQLSTSSALGIARTNEWDAEDRLVAVNAGNQRTEFTYDGVGRMASIRHLTNGSEFSLRRFVWCDNEICEERDAADAVTKRYCPEGMKVESGPAAGAYFYTRDHLGSVREVTDSAGTVRAHYSYDPYGRRTRVEGDVEADFGFAGMFWCSEAGLSLTRFRVYDANLGRWLSRDPLEDAEMAEGPNLYAYVGSNPINHVDPLGLAKCCEPWKEVYEITKSMVQSKCEQLRQEAAMFCAIGAPEYMKDYIQKIPGTAQAKAFKAFVDACNSKKEWAKITCKIMHETLAGAAEDYIRCLEKGCDSCADKKKRPRKRN